MSQFRYRGREIGAEDILYIRALIERHTGESRRKLSVRLCEAWQWRQANGALRDMVCRGMLLMLERPARSRYSRSITCGIIRLHTEPGRSRC